MPPDKAPSDEAVEAAAMSLYGEASPDEREAVRPALEAALPFLLEGERISTNMTMGEMLDKIKRLEALLADEREVDTTGLDLGPFDPAELVAWAEQYGHPEGWVKRAQAAHCRAEKAERVAQDMENAAELLQRWVDEAQARAEKAEAALSEARRTLVAIERHQYFVDKRLPAEVKSLVRGGREPLQRMARSSLGSPEEADRG